MLIKQQIMKNFEQELDNVKNWGIELFVNNIKRSGGITNEQNEILFRRYIKNKASGIEIENIIERTILILANDGLVWYVVVEHFGYDEDLYSVAKYGLIKAIDNFSFDRNCSFASFATKVMINEILMYKRKQKKQIEATIGVTSLDTPIENDRCEDGIKYELIPCDDDFVGDIIEKEYCKYIEKFFVYFTPIEQKVMIHTFGLFGNQPLNQIDVSKKVGVSQPYVCRLLERAIRKLKILINKQEGIENEEYKKITKKRYGLVKS